MALVLPVLLLLVLGGMDLSLMTNSKSNLDYVARTTSQCMVHNPSCPPQTFAAQLATGVNLRGTLTVTASGPPCPLPATSPLFSNRHGSRRLDANFAVFSYVHTYIRGYLSAVDDFLVAQLASFLRSFFRGLPLGSESPFGCDAL